LIIAHENEQRLRSLYDGFAQGDFDTVLGMCSDDVVFEVTGQGKVAGRYVGRPSLLDMIEKVMPLTAGTFREEVLDVVANDERGTVLVTQRFERGGRPVEYQTAHQWRIHGGRFIAWCEHPGNQSQFDEAWSRSFRGPRPPECLRRVLPL
jgi:ketosteroid isomerase-like protein